jgi:hypothetical protein
MDTAICGISFDLDDFWSPRLPASRQGTRWLNVLKTLVAYRLIDPGSEWRLHRQWYEQSAMGDLLGQDFASFDTVDHGWLKRNVVGT